MSLQTAHRKSLRLTTGVRLMAWLLAGLLPAQIAEAASIHQASIHKLEQELEQEDAIASSLAKSHSKSCQPPFSCRSTSAKTAEELPDLDAPIARGPIIREMSELTEADGTTIILPPNYDPRKPYPALVLMPYTNRTALHLFNWSIYDAYHRQTEDSFIIIMPPGQGSAANWSGAGWESLVSEYERYIQQALDPLVKKYNISREQLVIGGFSLGGDLSWTLSLRNPDIFSGAIVLGSMSTYRNDQNASQLADRDFRYFMAIGSYDGNKHAMNSAINTLDMQTIDYHYEEVGNAGHGDLPERMQRDLFLSAMDYVLANF